MSDQPYTLKLNTTLKNGDTLTIPYTYTTTTNANGIIGTFKSAGPWTVTSTGGTWSGTVYSEPPPDMTDWPPEDIIDWYALQLAKKHPA